MFTLNITTSATVLADTGLTQVQLDAVLSNIQLAAEAWGRYINAPAAEIDLFLEFSDLAGSTLATAGANFFSFGGPFLSEVVEELNGRSDSGGALSYGAIDANMTIDLPKLLAGDFFFSTSLDYIASPGAPGQTDFLSVMIHELGHSLGFLDLLFTPFMSGLSFTGANATSANGGSVLTTDGVHLADASDVLSASISSNVRNVISLVDVAILQDIGLPIAVATAGADTLFGFHFRDDILSGEGGSDTLNGLSGNDFLNGGAGVDTMIGGVGDDTYVVDVAGDIITELVSGGNDTVYSTASTYTLSANVETGVSLVTLTAAGLTGNALDNTLILNSAIGGSTVNGGAGADTIYLQSNAVVDAGSGNDIISLGTGNFVSGNTGDDTYILNGTGNTVNELFGGGTDTVFSLLASTTLAANVEVLALVGVDALNGTGNGLNNSIIGSTGNNVLFGLDGNDFLVAGAGNDSLVGGTGLDIMQGNTGLDTFFYNATAEAGDIIQDWIGAEDTFGILASAFGFTAGQTLLLGYNLIKSTAPVAVAATATFLWDSDDTAVYYDADGSGSASAPILLADLQAFTDVGVSDFVFF